MYYKSDKSKAVQQDHKVVITVKCDPTTVVGWVSDIEPCDDLEIISKTVELVPTKDRIITMLTELEFLYDCAKGDAGSQSMHDSVDSSYRVVRDFINEQSK